MSDAAFDRVLVANRGEIAVRIIRALRDMGISPVAVFSEADRDALHVRLADRAVCIGPAAAAESYLRIDRIIEAAREQGAQAIHPGYGFLSENTAMVEACDAAGIAFIGPPTVAMEQMGDKSAARVVAEKAGVPVVPGVADVADEDLAAAAEQVGFPLLLKPSAGGGGKGMVVVHDAADLLESATAARRVAKAAFGDDTLIVERWVHPARHVEIQVFADCDGRATALGERECSLQRRHQKVIEEAPSPATSADVRTAMCRSACDLAEAVGYRGAGTVEFLLGPDDSYYFLEMNTRLQVEHPVTEMVWGVDLVRAQVETAAGRPVPELAAASPRGWAIEARLYAEDPECGFLPTPGDILRLEAPTGPGVRFDSAFDGAGRVGTDYDPMIAKVVAWGGTRAEALRRLQRALAETVVLGITTNARFLSALVSEDWFAAGDFHVKTLEEVIERDGRIGAPPSEPPPAVLLAAAQAFRRPARSGPITADGAATTDPFTTLAGFRQLEGKRS